MINPFNHRRPAREQTPWSWDESVAVLVGWAMDMRMADIAETVSEHFGACRTAGATQTHLSNLRAQFNIPSVARGRNTHFAPKSRPSTAFDADRPDYFSPPIDVGDDRLLDALRREHGAERADEVIDESEIKTEALARIVSAVSSRVPGVVTRVGPR